MTPASQTSFAPGDNVRWLANQLAWNLESVSVIVEGELDQSYFAPAAELYEQEHNKKLIAPGFTIVPAGRGPAGGIDAILEHFPLLRKMIGLDLTPDGKPVFQALALLDSDIAGKRAISALTNRYVNCQLYRDVFLLQRCYPRRSRDLDQLARQIADANQEWKAIDCEIEDLVDRNILNEFASQKPLALRKPPNIQETAHHFEWERKFKPDLFRFVRENALLVDLEAIVDVLKSLRFFSGLDPDGD